MAACASVDIYERLLSKGRKAGVRQAYAATMIVAALSLGAAAYLVVTDQSEIYDVFLEISGLFGVPLAAMFFLGVMTVRANRQGVLAGLLVGVGCAGVAQYLDSSAFVVSSVAFITTTGLGYLFSIPFNRVTGGTPRPELRPLTIFDRPTKDSDKASAANQSPR